MVYNIYGFSLWVFFIPIVVYDWQAKRSTAPCSSTDRPFCTNMNTASEQTRPEPTDLVRLNLSEQIANRLRDMIIQNELVPGERIREREICKQLQVSRTPLREALQKLATEGLIDLVPNCGAVISAPQEEEVADMLQVLGALESFAGEKACELASEDELSEIKALHYEMLAAFARGDRLSYFKLNQKIHRSIVVASRSETLLSMHTRLNAKLYRIRYISNLRNELWGSAVEEHEQLMNALEARDAERLSTLLRRHLRSTWEKVSELMTSPEQEKGHPTMAR
jgi:DNA-binding GntR family transcriptional regulator